MTTAPVTGPLALPGGRWVVPGNRWDLVAARAAAEPDVTVVVTHFENQPDLDLVLAALAGQTHPRTRTQVVVADDGSRTPPDLGEAGRRLGARLVRQEDRGFRAAAARNLGAAAADGDVLVFLDADTVPEPDYLTTLARLPALVPDALVGGRRRHADLGGWTPARWAAWRAGSGPGPRELTEPGWLRDGHRRTRDLLDADPRSYRYLISATMACARSLFTELGGFDATMVGYGGEDWDLAFRAWNAGAVLAHVPAAVAWHDGPDWAERPLPEAERRRGKNAETLALARRIPEPSGRARGRRYDVPDTVVRMDVSRWPPASAVLAAESALSLGDVVVVVRGDGAATVLGECAADRRVRAEDPPAAVLARVRTEVRMHAPIRSWDPAGLVRLHEEGLGRVTVEDGQGVLLEMSAHRAVARTRRWTGALGPEAARLFPALRLPAAEAGVVRVDGEPSLAAVYGGWG